MGTCVWVLILFSAAHEVDSFVSEHERVAEPTLYVHYVLIMFALKVDWSESGHLGLSEVVLPALAEVILSHCVELVGVRPNQTELESPSCFAYFMSAQHCLWHLYLLGQLSAAAVFEGLDLVV